MVEEHEGGMSSRDKKNARRINAEFEFVGMGDRHGRRDRNYWEREQEQPPRRQAEHPPTSAPVVIPPPGPGGRRDGYRAALTVGGGKDLSPGSNTPQETRTLSPPRGDLNPAVAEYVTRCTVLW